VSYVYIVYCNRSTEPRTRAIFGHRLILMRRSTPCISFESNNGGVRVGSVILISEFARRLIRIIIIIIISRP